MNPVVALIPAHNEEAHIAATIRSLRRQGHRVEITVIVDNCTDDTAGVALRLGCQVLETVGNDNQKAGALNQGLRQILPRLAPTDHVLVVDADTVVSRQFLKAAFAALVDPTVGVVGGVFRGGEPHSNLLAALQRNEYDRYARQVGRRGGKALVLTGTASLFVVGVLLALMAERGYVYEIRSRTEDNEVTLAVLQLGYRPLSPKACTVVTELMPTFGTLWRQRYRWYRGSIEDLRRYGWNRTTAPYIIRQGLLVTSIIMWLLLLLLSLRESAFASVRSWSPIWIGVAVVSVVERVWTVRRGGRSAMLLSLPVIPELLYAFVLQAVFVTAVTGAFFRPDAERKW